MPNYSLRSKPGSQPNQPDEPMGSFMNRDIALDTLNQSIASDGKATGNAQLIIGRF